MLFSLRSQAMRKKHFLAICAKVYGGMKHGKKRYRKAIHSDMNVYLVMSVFSI
jgi:hypothetical protein